MKHAPRGPVKAKPDDLMAVADPMAVPSGLKRGNRCSATSKRTGKQCPMPAIAGGTVCRMHGGAAPQVQAAARERFLALQPKAFLTLESLIDRTEFPTVQMAAVREVFDRTEGKPAQAVAITGADNGPVVIQWKGRA